MYRENKENYKKLLKNESNNSNDHMWDIIQKNYKYKHTHNNNKSIKSEIDNSLEYATTYGELDMMNNGNENSIAKLKNIATTYNIDFFGDIGSGNGMIPAAMATTKGIKKTFGVELVPERHQEAVNFMDNILKKQNEWSKSESSFFHLINNNKPKSINKVIYQIGDRILEYVNGDMFMIDYQKMLANYQHPMFYISNLCFDKVTEPLFRLLAKNVKSGTIIISSRAPINLLDELGFSVVNNPDLGIINGKIQLAQTWNATHEMDVIMKI